MDIKKMLQDAVGNKIGEQFGFDNGKVGGILETISGVVSGGDKSSMLSSVGNMLGGSSSNDFGASIISALTTKNGLNADIAHKIKDMVMPLVMDYIKNKAGDKLGGMLGGLKF